MRKRSMKKKSLSGKLFTGLLSATSLLARNRRLNALTRSVMRSLAGLTLKFKGGRRKRSIEEIGREWQRMFPSRKFVPIVGIEKETVYAEIRTRCPLRATGDVQACYRLMEYDRRLMEVIGGEFVVLQSQAEPETEFCRVAIRKKGEPTYDLVPAHEKQRGGFLV
jgi:hypothetical protein